MDDEEFDSLLLLTMLRSKGRDRKKPVKTMDELVNPPSKRSKRIPKRRKSDK